MIRVAITGGICSGKSSVCSLVEKLGYSVYYCDARASYIIDHDRDIRSKISAIFGDLAYVDDRLNRPHISSRVFADRELLGALNGITHPKVIDDFVKWSRDRESLGDEIVFIESAILFESGLDTLVDRIISISSPVELRVERCAKRDNLPIEQIRGRIASQMSDEQRSSRSHYNILCDDKQLVIPQLLSVIDDLSK